MCVCACVCGCLSVWWWGGVALHPLLLCLLHRLAGLFLLWEQTVALFQSSTPLLLLLSLYPTDTALSLSLINPQPPHNPNSPCASHPLRRWERVREERQRETGQACTVENIVYARHKAACNFCSRGDTHKGWEGERGGARGRAEMGRKSSRIKTTTGL